MLDSISNSYSQWLDILFHWNFNIFKILQLNVKEKNDSIKNKNKIIGEKVILTYMILMWIVLYSIYQRCLNVYFRNLGYSLIHRNRISNVLWSCGFTSIIILYTLFLWDSFLIPELSVIILKSFYIHYCEIMVFRSNDWLNGFSNFLFVLFIFQVSQKILQPPINYVFLIKTIDILLLDCCRLLYLRWPVKVKQIYITFMYIIYYLFWTYFYMIFVTKNLLMTYKHQSSHEILVLWLWFITKYLDFVWLNYLNIFKKLPQLLELYLFPKPSKESIYLKKFLKNSRKIEQSKSKNPVAIKKELWQILNCAMTMKKKIKRLRESKQAKENKSLNKQEVSVEDNETK